MALNKEATLTPVSTSSTSARTTICTFASPSASSSGLVVLTTLEERRSTAPMGTGRRKVIWSRDKNRMGRMAKMAAFVKQSSLIVVSVVYDLTQIAEREECAHKAYEDEVISFAR